MNNLTRAAKYFQELPHQIEALDWLENRLKEATIEEFIIRYSPKATQPEASPPPKPLETGSPHLVFEMGIGHSDSLLTGTLKLYDGDRLVNTLTATSSYPGLQYTRSWNRRGGLIPPTAQRKLAGLSMQTVNTTPVDLSYVKGVSGNFYQINPFEQSTDGVTRSDIGIHFDANAPGSLGCLVMETKKGFQLFQSFMTEAKNKGISTLELTVIYSAK